jgi:hypothetical protein
MSFLRKVVRLCTGFANYREVIEAPLTASLKYVGQLLVILALVLTAALIPRLLDLTSELAVWIDKTLPPITLHDGKVASTVAQPYQTGNNNFLFVLDTTGQVTGPVPTATQGLLLTADSLVVWLKATNTPAAVVQTQRHSLAGFPDGTLNGDYLRHLVHALLWVGVPLAVLLLTGAAAVATLVQAWLFAFAASFLERRLPGALGFRQLLNLAIHAVTPAAIVFTVYAACQLKELDLWLVYLVAYGIFLIGAANACRRPLVPEEERADQD